MFGKMMLIRTFGVIGLGVMLGIGGASSGEAASLTLENTYNLSAALSANQSNFNPQGLGYDASTNELLFMQQWTNTIYRSDLTGSVGGIFAARVKGCGLPWPRAYAR